MYSVDVTSVSLRRPWPEPGNEPVNVSAVFPVGLPKAMLETALLDEWDVDGVDPEEKERPQQVNGATPSPSCFAARRPVPSPGASREPMAAACRGESEWSPPRSHIPRARLNGRA